MLFVRVVVAGVLASLTLGSARRAEADKPVSESAALAEPGKVLPPDPVLYVFYDLPSIDSEPPPMDITVNGRRVRTQVETVSRFEDTAVVRVRVDAREGELLVRYGYRHERRRFSIDPGWRGPIDRSLQIPTASWTAGLNLRASVAAPVYRLVWRPVAPGGAEQVQHVRGWLSATGASLLVTPHYFHLPGEQYTTKPMRSVAVTALLADGREIAGPTIDLDGVWRLASTADAPV